MVTVTSREKYTVAASETEEVILSNGTIYTIVCAPTYDGRTRTKVWRQDFEGDYQRRSTLKAYRAEAGL